MRKHPWIYTLTYIINSSGFFMNNIYTGSGGNPLSHIKLQSHLRLLVWLERVNRIDVNDKYTNCFLCTGPDVQASSFFLTSGGDDDGFSYHVTLRSVQSSLSRLVHRLCYLAEEVFAEQGIFVTVIHVIGKLWRNLMTVMLVDIHRQGRQTICAEKTKKRFSD